MLNGPRGNYALWCTCLFLAQQDAPLFIFLGVLITVAGSLGNTFPRTSCQHVSGLGSTKQRPPRVKEAETIILHPVRPRDLQRVMLRSSFGCPGNGSSGAGVSGGHQRVISLRPAASECLMAGDKPSQRNSALRGRCSSGPSCMFKPLVHLLNFILLKIPESFSLFLSFLTDTMTFLKSVLNF